jgi:hypothetical protein
MSRLAVLLLVVACIGAGCFGKGGDDGSPDPTPSTSTTPEPPSSSTSTSQAPQLPTSLAGPVTWDAADVKVNAGPLFPGDEQNVLEPTVAIDPTDPRRMFLAAIDRSPVNDDPAIYATNRMFHSTDSGATWADLGPVPHPDGHLDSGDPVAIFDAQGVLYLASLVDPPEEYRYVYVFRSLDAGLTWEEPGVAFLPSRAEGPPERCTSTDKEWLSLGSVPGELLLTQSSSGFICALDEDDPTGGGEVVAIETTGITFTRSLDGGKSWSAPTQVWDGYALGSQPRVAPDGTLHVAFWAAAPTTTNGCVSAVGALLARASAGPFSTIVVATSKDGGTTWGHHLQSMCMLDLVAPDVKPGIFAGGDFMPTFARDASTGGLLVVYPTFRREDQRFTLEAIRSADEGATWSEPVEATPAPVEAHLPALHAANGVARLLYVSNHEDSHGNTWVTESRDGGATWSQPAKVSSVAQDLEPDPDIGDYVFLDAAAGRIAAAWADAREGPSSIRVRTGTIASTATDGVA